jgi:lysophospholipase L1-like esterase
VDQLRQRFPGLIVKKIAQDGANSSWMKSQLEQELQNNKYDAIGILSGSNDVYGGVNIGLTKYNLDAMYRLAHIKGSKVLAITPPNKDFYTQKTDQKQVALHELVDWIKGNRNIDFLIDFYTITNNKSFFNSNDGYLHPQAGAHSILAQQVAQKLNLA